MAKDPVAQYEWAKENTKSVSLRVGRKLLKSWGYTKSPSGKTSGSHQQWFHPDVPLPQTVSPNPKDKKMMPFYQVIQITDAIKEHLLADYQARQAELAAAAEASVTEASEDSHGPEGGQDE